MNKRIYVIILGLFVIIGQMPGLIPTVYGEALEIGFLNELHLTKGELITIQTKGLQKVSVTNPEIVDIVSTENDEVLIIAKGDGQTALFIWDRDGKHNVIAYVISQNLEAIKNRIEQLFKVGGLSNLKLEANDNEGKVVISGDIPRHKKEKLDHIIEPFFDTTINLVNEEKIDEMVQIDMQITELNSTLVKNLGVEWITGKQTTEDDGTIVTTHDGETLKPTFLEILPSSDGSVADLFKIGKFYRSTSAALVAEVNALIEKGEARILSNPKLVVVSGEEADFLVGGEIPIRTLTTNSSGGSSTENVEFKEYGVKLTISPTIRKKKIDVSMNIDITEIDNTNKVGENVAFTKRTAQTRLFLEDGQTIFLAGLIKQNTSETVRQVPFLGSIPVLGLLFRNRKTTTPNQDQELVISLTPHKVIDNENKVFQGQTLADKKPQQKTRDPNNKNTADRIAHQKDDVNNSIGINGIKQYIRSVQEQIAGAIIYPEEAEEYGWEGQVKVDLLILSDGTLVMANINETSGYDLFDENALNAVENSTPYSNFPPDTDLQELSITLPIVYRLDRY
jgi:pilus assembly protein CpaC